MILLKGLWKMTKDEVIRELEIYTVGRPKDFRPFISVGQLQNLLDVIKKLPDCEYCKTKQENVLNKVKAEIESLPKTYPFVNHFDMYVKEDDVKRIIDKHKAEREDKE
jgi:hypothetical protein